MKSKRRQIFYVFLSLLIASMVWFYVSNSDEITVNVHDVAIEFLNEDTTLADKGLMRVSGEEDMSVDLRLKFPRRLAYSSALCAIFPPSPMRASRPWPTTSCCRAAFPRVM